MIEAMKGRCGDRRPVFRWIVLSSVSLSLFAGCGGGTKGPPRENVSGKVTYDGKPVPHGFIDFRLPDGSVVSTIQIKDGAYASASGEGPAAGQNDVGIAGFDKEGGFKLWQGQFKAKAEIAKGNNEKNFEITTEQMKPFDPKKAGLDEGDESI